MAAGWMAAGQAPLRVTQAGSEPGTLSGDSSHPRDTRQDTRPAQPKERPTGHPSCHPTLDCEPGLNALPGRAATLSQEKETNGSGCLKATALFALRKGKPRSFCLPLCGPGGSAPILASAAPAQPHQPGPMPWQRQWLSDKDQLQPPGGLAAFPHKALSTPQHPQDEVEALKSPTLCVLVCVHHHKAVRRKEPTIPSLSSPCSPIPSLTAYL